MELVDNQAGDNGKEREEDIWAGRKLPTGSFDFEGTGTATAEEDGAPQSSAILESIERVRQNPGRAMLVVTGLGFLLGSVLRRR
jgi:hypothetical protein